MTLPLLSRSLEAMTSAMEPQAFHRALAHWNHKRLAVGTPSADWIGDVREEHRMRLLEGGFVESFRAEVEAACADVPRDADGFVAWFETLKQDGPGQGDPLFPWLAEHADLEQMRWFLTQEAAGEAGFEDLVALAQIKLPPKAKLELARNYWDEMGRGHEGGMHGPMLEKTVHGLQLEPRIDDTVWPSLALANTLTAFATTRRYAYHAIGALGVVELTAPTRVRHVAAGLKRLGVEPRLRKYFELHAQLDIHHSQAWNQEALGSLVRDNPDCAPLLAEGAMMRLICGQRCFETYRAHLWGRPAILAAE
jgi:hypothetical protein